jgi:hypothetical protein
MPTFEWQTKKKQIKEKREETSLKIIRSLFKILLLFFFAKMSSRASSIIPAQRSNSLASISIGGTSSMELDLPDNKEDEEEDKWWRRMGNGHKMSSISTISWLNDWHRISSGDEELRKRIAELTKWDDTVIPHRRHHRRYKYGGLLEGHVNDHFERIWPPPPPPPIPSSFPLSRPSIGGDDHHQIPYPLWDGKNNNIFTIWKTIFCPKFYFLSTKFISGKFAIFKAI